VQYGGYEPVVELAMVAVFEHTADTIAGVEAQALLLSQVVDIPPLEPPVAVTDDDLVDAEQEVLFVTQAQIDAREQVRFEQAMERIERHMEDRIIVLVRARGELRERLRDARARREAAMGAEARIRVEAECKEISGELENADGEIARLRARNDPDYDNWSQRALQRRFAPPRVERILELEFLLA
jgi:hypothetical protein